MSSIAQAVAACPLLPQEPQRKVMAKADLRFSEKPEKPSGAQLREAIKRANLTLSEASALCDVRDEAQFRRMVDGKENFDVHRLLTEKAQPIWDELTTVKARASGYTVRISIERTA